MTSLNPPSLRVEPGAADAVFTLTLRNEGDTVEEYQLSLIGAPAAWGLVEPQSIRLFPGAQGTAQITLSPPRSPSAMAGLTPFGVQVRPRQNADLFDVAEASVMVGEFRDVRATLAPSTVRGRLSARPKLSVSNFGNAPLTAAFTPRDEEDALDFSYESNTLEVWPGQSNATRLKVRPQRLRLTGQQNRYPFAVGVGRAEEIDDPRNRLESRGTFVRIPLFPKWLLALLALLTVIALGVVAFLAIPLPNFGSVAQELAIQQPPAAAALPPPPVVATVAPVAAPPPPPVVTPPPPAATQDQSQSNQNQGNNNQNQNQGNNNQNNQNQNNNSQNNQNQNQGNQNQQAMNQQLGGLQKDQNGNGLATITSRQDGNYLTVQNGSQDDGTPVIVQGKQNQQNQPVALNQFWVLVNLDQSGVNMALSPGNAPGTALTRDDDADQVRIRTVDGGDAAIRQGQVNDNQRWTFTVSDNDFVLITNGKTGECLTNAGVGQPARALKCEDRLKSLQQWKLGDS